MRICTTTIHLLTTPRTRLAGVVCLCLTSLGIQLPYRARLCAEDLKAPQILKEHTGRVWGVAFSPDGKTLASASSDKTIKLWDLAKAQERVIFKGHDNEVFTVAFSPDGKTLASGSADKAVKLWDTSTGKERATLQGHTDYVLMVCFSPNGKSLTTASFDNTVKVWDVANGKELISLLGHAKAVTAVAYSPDGNTLASASDDCTVKLWEVSTGKERATLQGHTRGVNSIVFSPDGKTMASTSDDHTIKVWESATGKERVTLFGHMDRVWKVAYSPDGKTLASASDDRTVRLWEVSTGKERATLQGHTDVVWSVTYSPDGKTLASASYDKTVRLWNIPVIQRAESPQYDFQVNLLRKQEFLRRNSGLSPYLSLMKQRLDDENGLEMANSSRLAPETLEQMWKTLAGDDASQSYRVIGKLIAAPREAISLVSDRLQPVSKVSPHEVTRCITDLDSRQFVVRETAEEALEKAGEPAKRALRKKLEENPSLEVRQRIERLLTNIEQLTSDAIRVLRAVEVLEHIGTSEARQVLETLATGAEGARLTEEAEASLQRLKKRVVADK